MCLLVFRKHGLFFSAPWVNVKAVLKPRCDNIDIKWYWDCTSCGSWPIPSLCCRGAWIWQVLYWDNRSVKQTVSSMGKRTNNYLCYATHVPMAFFVPVQVHSAKFHDRKFGSLRCDKLSSCSNWSWDVEVTRHTRHFSTPEFRIMMLQGWLEQFETKSKGPRALE